MIIVDVEVVDDEYKIDPDAVKSLAQNILSHGGQSDGQLTVIFTHDELLRELKNHYFKQDVYTDVIAFRLDENNELFEGEIYISPKRAGENSTKFNEPLERELARLVCHGCLHLLGRKDKTEKQKTSMKKEEDLLLKKFAPNKILIQ